MREDALRAAFRSQADSCAQLGSPFTARLCRIASEHLDRSTEVGRHLLAWQGDPRSSADSVPLRLAGALHGLVIEEMDEALASIYPPNTPPEPDSEFWRIVSEALHVNRDYVFERLESAPQTNEIRRSIPLYAALACVADTFDLPISLLELGASAGLNLFCDQYAYELKGERFGAQGSTVLHKTDWRGNLPPHARVVVHERRGCDLNPLDLASKVDIARLHSYLWPDQPERIERTAKAVALAANMPGLAYPLVERMDAAAWLESRLASRSPGIAHVVQHSIAFQYFPSAVQKRCRELIESAGQAATRETPLAWVSMEADDLNDGAALLLQTWPTGDTRELARVDFHGRWVSWRI